MTNEELQKQIEAIQADLGQPKWVKVNDLMLLIEALTDAELVELSNRVSVLTAARNRKIQEMMEEAKQCFESSAKIHHAPKEQQKELHWARDTETVKKLFENIRRDRPAP